LRLTPSLLHLSCTVLHELGYSYPAVIDADVFAAAVNHLVVTKKMEGCIILQNVSSLYGRVWQSVRMLMHKNYYEIMDSPDFEEVS